MKVEGLPPTPQAELIIDREKAAALGVKFEDINATIQVNLGSVYTNDFPNQARCSVSTCSRAVCSACRRPTS